MNNAAHIISQQIHLTHYAHRIYNTMRVYNTTRTDISILYLHRNIDFVQELTRGMVKIVNEIIELEEPDDF